MDAHFIYMVFLTSFDFPEKSEVQKFVSGNGNVKYRDFLFDLHDVMYAHKSFLTSFDFPEKSEVQKLESGNGSEISRISI